jgi:hypothetical protein
MQCSEDIFVVILLDAYLSPTPVMTEFVRKQLLNEEEEERIRDAIEGRMKNPADISGLYSKCLSRSGFVFAENSLAVLSLIKKGILQRALFDLMTAQRAKLFQLKGYSDVHEVRAIIKSFFVKNRSVVERTNLDKLWWDEADLTVMNRQPWVSAEVRHDPDFMLRFLPVFDSWLSDSDGLQRWLDDFEEYTTIVNNPKSQNRVFSQTVALEILDFAKVRYLN